METIDWLFISWILGLGAGYFLRQEVLVQERKLRKKFMEEERDRDHQLEDYD